MIPYRPSWECEIGKWYMAMGRDQSQGSLPTGKYHLALSGEMIHNRGAYIHSLCGHSIRVFGFDGRGTEQVCEPNRCRHCDRKRQQEPSDAR